MDADCPFCQKLTRLNELPGDEVVGQFAHSVALLGDWQIYPGYCVLVARRHVTELHHLPDAERRGFLDELCLLARAIESAFRPRKLNYELLGNQVPHLHGHVFPRPPNDPDPLRPVWFTLERAKESAAEEARLRAGPVPRAEVARRVREELGSDDPSPERQRRDLRAPVADAPGSDRAAAGDSP
jgi:diadenosine tetraphosphate (Ap4A) HIT family hydrolase